MPDTSGFQAERNKSRFANWLWQSVGADTYGASARTRWTTSDHVVRLPPPRKASPYCVPLWLDLSLVALVFAVGVFGGYAALQPAVDRVFERPRAEAFALSKLEADGRKGYRLASVESYEDHYYRFKLRRADRYCDMKVKKENGAWIVCGVQERSSP